MTAYDSMQLMVQLPYERIVDRDVRSLVAEGTGGAFCLLPNHLDCVARLAPSLLTVRSANDVEQLMAVDRGTLVKIGNHVRIATRRAVIGGRLGDLQALIEREFMQQTERERTVLTAMAKLESSLVRRFLEFSRE